MRSRLFFFNDTAPTEIYTLSLHDALPISRWCSNRGASTGASSPSSPCSSRSEEHTSELQSRLHLVCRLLLEKKKKLNYSPANLPILYSRMNNLRGRTIILTISELHSSATF